MTTLANPTLADPTPEQLAALRAEAAETEDALRQALSLAFEVDAGRLSVEILLEPPSHVAGVSVLLDGEDLSAEQEAFVTKLLGVVARAVGGGPFVLASKA